MPPVQHKTACYRHVGASRASVGLSEETAGDTMRFLSLFSGIEAASSAWLPLGWECVAVSEIDPFACAVLAHHYPDVPNLGDITKITESDIAMLGDIDLVVFGSPCQDLSVAGKRKGLDGARSGLFFNAMQIVEWARIWGDCRFALWENVPGAFSSNSGADFGVVVGQMAGMECAEIPPKGWGTEGAIVGPQGMVEWAVLDAQWAGVAQRRRRVFAIADFGDWSSRPPILLEPESLRGDTAPSRETGQSVAGTLASRTGAGGYPGTDEACSGHVICSEVSPTLDQRAGRSGANSFATSGGLIGLQRSVLEPVLCAATGQAGAEITSGYSPTLNCNHEAPYVAYGVTIHGTDGTKTVASFSDTAQCLRARTPGAIDNSSTTVVLQQVGCVTGRITHTLKAEGFDASEDGTGRGTPIVPVAYGFQPRIGRNGRGDMGDVVATLSASSGDAAPCVAYQTTGENYGWMDGGTPQGSNDLSTGSVRDLCCSGCRSTSQERGLEGSQAGELATSVPQLPHESTPLGDDLPAMRKTAQGAWLLRPALPEGEAPRRPGIQTAETCMQCGGLRSAESRERLLRQTFSANETRDAWQTADDQKRSGVITMAVRRLTPRECERLQSFKDDHTLITVRGKPAADGPRYKALGNSMCVNVMAWIGKQIDHVVTFY